MKINQMNSTFTNPEPLISVIITCFNDGIFLNECIKSVTNSTYENIEIIVVDDCSTDSITNSLLHELEISGIKVLKKQKNKGVANSRNIGIQNAQASYILTLDADDTIQNTYIEKSLKQLLNGYSVVYCDVQHFGKINSVRIASEFSIPLLLTGNFIANCSAFTKEIWNLTGGFDVEMECYEDWEFWINAASKGAKFYHLNEILFNYRRKDDSLNAKCNDPKTRAKIVNYVCTKHSDIYNRYMSEIISNLHSIISSMQKDIIRLEEIASSENKLDLVEKLKSAENLLANKIEYYENSFFWKLKKTFDKLRGH